MLTIIVSVNLSRVFFIFTLSLFTCVYETLGLNNTLRGYDLPFIKIYML